MKNILLSIFPLLILFSCNLITKEPETIDGKIIKALKENNVPSLSIGVIKKGKIDLLKGFGNISRADSTKVNEYSIFQIASQSKMFTGIIVRNLLKEGKLNLNEPITTYLPDGIQGKNKTRLKKIKLKNLLNHTAGLSRDGFSIYRDRVEGEAWRNGYPRTKLIDDINNIELETEPGTTFQYSNSGYAVVGLICENVSGLKFEELLKKYVTKKYDLKNTVINLDTQQQKMFVTPYKKTERVIETQASLMGMATPASAIYSNANDLTKILYEQINAYRENEIQNPLFLTNQTSKMDEGLHYGFGLIEETKGDNIKYGHGGDADGFACEYFFNPKKNIGVVLLTSSGGSWVGELANEIMEDLK